jgi:hypothetical protein
VIQSLIYDILLVACWAYAMLKGGAPERIGASILLAGSALTFVMVTGPARRFASMEIGILLVDVAALLAFLVLALRAERYWPLWITGLQLIGTAGHVVKLVEPDVIRWAYAFVLAFWAYPMMLLLAVGTWLHQRRLALHGADRSWSTSSARSAPTPPPGPTA